MKKVGHKTQDGKTRYDLLPTNALEWVAKAMTYGAKKHGEREWENKKYTWGLYFGAIMRHMWAFWRGQQIDKESGIPHLALAGASVLILFEIVLTRPLSLDDRSKLRG